ncbi:MAG: efflux RND transporter periplasmic adaptor subunit [Pseudomonadota bacterium]
MNIAIVIAAGLLLSGYILSTGPALPEAGPVQTITAVSVASIERRMLPRDVQAFGMLLPRRSLKLASQVPGRVSWVSEQLIPGFEVESGEPLVRIDEQEYAIAVATAEASVAQAEAAVELERGQARMAQQEWLAREQAGRQRPAVLGKRLALREPQRADAEAQLKSAQAELDRATLALNRTAIAAPWPALVVDVSAVAGQLLSVDEVTATLYPLDSAVVELKVPVDVLQDLEQGIEKITLRAANRSSVPPVVGVLEGLVRSLSDDTRLATIRVRVDRPLHNEGWAFGMHLQARIEVRAQRSVALVPADLLVSGNMVWVCREGKALRHEVQPLSELGVHVAVVDSFEVNDVIILERPVGLFDGAEVAVSAG